MYNVYFYIKMQTSDSDSDFEERKPFKFPHTYIISSDEDYSKHKVVKVIIVLYIVFIPYTAIRVIGIMMKLRKF